MARKLCDLCQRESESDVRFGVRLCQNCPDDYAKAMSGDSEAIDYLSDSENFPYATEAARKQIVARVAKRFDRLEMDKEETQKQREIEKRGKRRISYAESIGIDYRESANSNAESSVDSLYADIGKKIKGWAKWIFIIETIAAVISAIGMLLSSTYVWTIWVALSVLIFGPILAWISSWILYGFGELIDKTCANERNTRNILKIMLDNAEKQ